MLFIGPTIFIKHLSFTFVEMNESCLSRPLHCVALLSLIAARNNYCRMGNVNEGARERRSEGARERGSELGRSGEGRRGEESHPERILTTRHEGMAAAAPLQSGRKCEGASEGPCGE
jgi:hypothetical protein